MELQDKGNGLIECRKKEIKTIIDLTESLMTAYRHSTLATSAIKNVLDLNQTFTSSEEKNLRTISNLLTRLSKLLNADGFLDNEVFRTSAKEILDTCIDQLNVSCDRLKKSVSGYSDVAKKTEYYLSRSKITDAQAENIRPILLSIKKRVS